TDFSARPFNWSSSEEISGRASRETASAALRRSVACRSRLASSITASISDFDDESSGTAGSMLDITGSVRRLPSAGAVGDGVGHGLSAGAAAGVAAMGGKGTAAKPSGKGNQSEGGKAMPQKFPETSSSTPT